MCPNCGHCPHCGRSNPPSWIPMPYVQPYPLPYQPHWTIPYGVITYGTTTIVPPQVTNYATKV